MKVLDVVGVVLALAIFFIGVEIFSDWMDTKFPEHHDVQTIDPKTLR